MSLFPFLKNKENTDQDQTKDRNDFRLTQYKEVLKRYKQSMEEFIQRLSLADNQPVEGHLSIVQTSMQLSQIMNQMEEILLQLEEIKLKESGWSQEQSEEALNQGRKALDQMESLAATLIETNYKLEELDKRMINNMNTEMSEMHKQLLYHIKEEQAGLRENYLKIHKTVKGNRALLWLLFILQFIGLGAIAFIILYLLDLLPFL